MKTLKSGSDELDQILRFDALDTAERLTDGDQGAANALGFILMQANGKVKDELLNKNDDTLFSNTVARYTRILADLGFEQVMVLPFVGRSYRSEPRAEQMQIWAHRDGFLLRFDTYNTTSINAASVYYNVQGKRGDAMWRAMSSGHFASVPDCPDQLVLVGDHDAREALRHKLAKLQAAGTPLKQWIERPFLWLLHCADTKDENGETLGHDGYDHNAINEQRIKFLPKWVREMITPAA